MRGRYLIFAVMFLLLVSCNSQTKEELLQSGLELLESGNARGSIVYLKNALEKDPNFSQARYHLADAYLKSGRLERAENEFKKVSLQSSSFPDLPLNLAEIYLLTSRVKLAVQTIDKYHDEEKANSHSLDILGQAHALNGEYDKAENLLREAILHDPEAPGPKFHLVKLLQHQSRNEEARKHLQLIIEKHNKFLPAYEALARLELQLGEPSSALSLYRQLYKLDTNNINALYMQGIVLYVGGQFEDAAVVTEKLVTAFPEDYRTSQLSGLISYRQEKYDDALVSLLDSLQKNRQPLTNYFLGLSYFRLNNLEQSTNQFNKILDVKPDMLQARLMLAAIYLRQNRIVECIREARYVLTIDKENGAAYNLLGSAQLMRNDYEEAMQSFNRAIEINPAAADIYLKKGRSHISLDEEGLAEAALQEALSLSPKTLNARLMLATVYVRQENYELASEVLQEGLTGEPADALIYNFLANVNFKQNDEQTAIKSLQSAKRVYPEYISSALTLASYYLARAEYEKAATEYLEVLSIDSGHIKSLIGLGLAYELSGENGSAQSIYQRLLELGTPESILYVAQLYSRSNRTQEALTLIDKGINKHISYAPLYELKATILLHRNQVEETLDVLELLEQRVAGRGYPRMISLLLKQGQTAQAEKIAERQIQEQPEVSYGYLLLSTIYISQKEYEKAAEIVKRGLSKVRKYEGLSLRLGHIHELTDNTMEAVKTYEDLLRSSPESSVAAFAMGALYDRLGNNKEAQQYYQKTISLNGHHVPALNNLAYLYAGNYGDKSMALNLVLRAYRLAPGQPDVMDTLGFVLMKSGRVKEAVKILEKANVLDRSNPSISFHLALAYVELNQTDKAIVELEKTLEIDNFPEAERCKQLLARLKT